MGREARCHCRWGDESGAVKALLETDELIVRGEVKRRARLTTLAQPRADGDVLRFTAGGEPVELSLGAREAALWVRRMTEPPPSLAAKLGVGPHARALVLGEVSDAALSQALEGATTSLAAEARVLMGVVADEAEVAYAIDAHAALTAGAPIWIIHGKGKSAAIGDNAVRALMRAAGYIDTKVAAVSDSLSATRYAKRT